MCCTDRANLTVPQSVGSPGGSVVKTLPANAGYSKNVGSIPGLGRSPGVGNGNPLQYPCLGNPMGRGAWRATVRGAAHTSYWFPSACLPPPTFSFPCFILINPFRTDHVLETILSTFYIISHSTLIQSSGAETINIPILQMGKLWLRVA